MGLSIDRKAFSDILSRGVVSKLAARTWLLRRDFWGWSKEYLETVPGYGADVEKSREEGRQIMKSLGYGPDKMLQLKVTTRNIPDYRDAAVILIDHLKSIYIQGELEPVDTSVWYARLAAQGLLGCHERPGHRHRRPGRAVLRKLPVWFRTQLYFVLQSR